MRATIATFLKQTLLIMIGSLIFAFAVKTLIVPQNLLAGGLTGFALAVFVGAALAGTGTAIILKSYGSSGGAGILCVIGNRRF